MAQAQRQIEDAVPLGETQPASLLSQSQGLGAPEGSRRGGTFIVDYDRREFLKDGHPFRFRAGAVHYFRVPSAYWKDRLFKLKAAGLNTVETYVEWSGHEPEPRRFNFDGNYDLIGFLETAQSLGLLVILRPGPYIGAERDNGGLPYWLLRLDPNMKLRTSDKNYLERVDNWFGVLLPLVKPLLYENGGPVIAVQVENEYGSYWSCEEAYLEHLVEVIRMHLGRRVPLFTTDHVNKEDVECGGVEGAVAAVVIRPGDDVRKAFELASAVNAGKGPFIVGQFYTGWFDYWGRQHAKVDGSVVAKTLREILVWNASFVLYMFHGGTNFGFKNGAGEAPQPTSYDYAAPLSEAGDPRELYFTVRKVLYEHDPWSLPQVDVPKPTPKLEFGPVKLSCGPSFPTVMRHLRSKEISKTVMAFSPLSFEELGQDYGYVLYKTVLPFSERNSIHLRIPAYRDRAYVISRDVVRVMDASQRTRRVEVPSPKGKVLTIIVENTGRVSYGDAIGQRKGILSNVTADKKRVTLWIMEGVPLSREKDIAEVFAFVFNDTGTRRRSCDIPGFFFTNFTLRPGQVPHDTFLDPSGWTKGVAFLNGISLGRYWPVAGPQVTLYVPGVFLRPFPQWNYLLLLEMEGVDRERRTVAFVPAPIINGTSSSPKSVIHGD